MVRHKEQQFRCWNFKFWQCDLVKCHVIKDWWIARLMLNAIEPNKLWLQRSNVSAPGKTDVKVIVQCLCPRKDRCVLSLPWAKHMFLWKWLCNVSGPGKKELWLWKKGCSWTSVMIVWNIIRKFECQIKWLMISPIIFNDSCIVD